MNLEHLREIILKNTDIDVKDRTTRKQPLPDLKKIFCYIAYNSDLRHSFNFIGEFLGLTHASVMNHYYNISKAQDKYKVLANNIITAHNLNVPMFRINKHSLKIKDRTLEDIKTLLSRFSIEDIKEFKKDCLVPYIANKHKNYFLNDVK